MKIDTYFFLFLITVSVLLLAVPGCSDHSSNPDLNENGEGAFGAEVSVIGAISDDHTGAAFFVHSTHAFTIHLGGHDNDNFDVDITIVDLDNAVSIPSTGTYTIGNLETDDFRGDYVNRRLGGNWFGDHHYTTDLAGGNGVLIIETVTSSLIAGSFEFAASLGVHTDGTPIDLITVSGDFVAIPD